MALLVQSFSFSFRSILCVFVVREVTAIREELLIDSVTLFSMVELWCDAIVAYAITLRRPNNGKNLRNDFCNRKLF